MPETLGSFEAEQVKEGESTAKPNYAWLLAPKVGAAAEAARPRHEVFVAPKSAEISETLEEQILGMEKNLGIITDMDRVVESARFIDRPILEYAATTGRGGRLERLFGDEAYAGHLEARQFLKHAAPEQLSLELILDLHKALTHRSQHGSGKLRNLGAQGGDYEDPDRPRNYSTEQVEVISRNPGLQFLPATEDNPEEETRTGFIMYPHQKAGPATQDAIKEDLEGICSWYNDAWSHQHNPYDLAAGLQRRLAALHPFLDGNGRLSRTLMNWSLEREDKPASALAVPDEDILTEPDDWAAVVEHGSGDFGDMMETSRLLQEASIESPAAALGLGKEKAFYDYVFKYLRELPALTGGHYNHAEIESYFDQLTKDFAWFEDFTARKETSEEPAQGGLITQEFMLFASSPRLQREASPALINRYFSQRPIYRGAMIKGNVDDASIIRVFQQYTGACSGYRALAKSMASSESLAPIAPQLVGESMDYYNKTLASAYLASAFVDSATNAQNPYTGEGLRPFHDVADGHVDGSEENGIMESFFASTSISLDASTKFSDVVDEIGILVSSRLPREGVVSTSAGYRKIRALGGGRGVPFEKEILLAGGLQPSSIQTVDITRELVHVLRARRQGEGATADIVIVDRRDSSGLNELTRTYVFDHNTQEYVLEKEEVTNRIPPGDFI